MLPDTLFTAEQVRRIEHSAIERYGIPGGILMERAGQATYDALAARWPSAGRILVLCGAGNNGGDGFVIARLAHRAGRQVRVCMLGDPGRLGPDAQRMLERMREVGVTAERLQPAPGSDGADLPADRPDLIVDALFGTGLSRTVEGDWGRAIALVNRHAARGVPVVSVDIPSGLHCDTGAVLGDAVRADCTVTFIGLKRGLFTGAGREHCGEVVYDALEVPAAVLSEVAPAARRIDATALADLPRRARDAHKGTHGHVLVIGGDHGYAGAARLAAEASGRTGAGLVSVATREAHAGLVGLTRPELMCRGVESASRLAELLARADAVAVGPGLGTGSWGRSMLAAALAWPGPLVVDADGLNLLAESAVAPRSGWVLTPHPAEAGRLLGVPTAEVQRDRFHAAAAIADRYGAVCVLKGSGTVVAAGAEVAAVCSGGNPGMATGGSGDALTGVIAALLAEGYAPSEAARLGVCLHAAAGDHAARDGERGMLAGDLIASLRPVLAASGGPPRLD